MKCKRCGSYAINHHMHDRDGSDPDLCDVCYWQTRAEENHLRILGLISDRDRYQFQAEQKWRLRRELETLLGVEEGMDSDEALRVGVEKIKALKEGK